MPNKYARLNTYYIILRLQYVFVTLKHTSKPRYSAPVCSPQFVAVYRGTL